MIFLVMFGVVVWFVLVVLFWTLTTAPWPVALLLTLIGVGSCAALVMMAQPD